MVGLLAMVTPQVMSSGHGALRLSGVFTLSLWTVASLFVLKIAASIVSLGSGFRGGLFFSSLLMGALGGDLLAIALTMAWPSGHFDPNAYALIGMSALSASVIGGPLTMTFIALETTGDLWLTTAVLIAVIISAQDDAGILRLFVRHLALPSARRDHPQRRRHRLDARTHCRQDDAPRRADRGGRRHHRRLPRRLSRGLDHLRHRGRRRQDAMRAWSASPMRMPPKSRPANRCGTCSTMANDMLLPGMAIKDAVLAFDRAEAESLPVVNSYLDRRVVGLLTEAHALRRYSAELERRRQELIGDI